MEHTHRPPRYWRRHYRDVTSDYPGLARYLATLAKADPDMSDERIFAAAWEMY